MPAGLVEAVACFDENPRYRKYYIRIKIMKIRRREIRPLVFRCQDRKTRWAVEDFFVLVFFSDADRPGLVDLAEGGPVGGFRCCFFLAKKGIWCEDRGIVLLCARWSPRWWDFFVLVKVWGYSRNRCTHAGALVFGYITGVIRFLRHTVRLSKLIRTSFSLLGVEYASISEYSFWRK